MLIFNRSNKKTSSSKQGILGEHEFILSNADGSLKERKFFKNIIVDAGLSATGELLAGLVLNSDGVNYCALGTGSVSVSASDTVLENEGARKIRGSSQTSGTQFIVAFYFNPTEANGAWTRYATLIDGTDVAGTGTLFSHAEVSITKSSGEGLTINSQYTVVDL